MFKLLISAAVIAVPATPATAHDDSRALRVEVSYADLELQTADGRRMLDKRLRAASVRACESYEPLMRFRSCMSDLSTATRRELRLAIAKHGRPNLESAEATRAERLAAGLQADTARK